MGKNASGTTFNVSTYYGFDGGDRVRTDSGGGKYGPGDDIAPFSGTALTFEHDLDGNLTRRYGGSTDVRYGWDAIGHLTSVTVPATGATVNYDYNASGQLVRRRTNGTIDRHFLWDGDNLLAELDGTAGSRIAEYVHWGLDQPLAVLSGPYTYNELDYVVQDARGNVRMLFGQTSDARINFQTDYSDWGTPVNTTWGTLANRLLFKGMFYEGDSTKLYYARNRWYSPEFGGFISEDPIGFDGGINVYEFASGDPINRSDPTGLDDCKWVYHPGAWTSTYDWDSGQNLTLWTEPGRLMYECTGHTYDESSWEARNTRDTGNNTATNSGIDYKQLAKTAGRKALACSGDAASFALAVAGSSEFYEGGKVALSLWRKALQSEASRAATGKQFAKAAARLAKDAAVNRFGATRAAAGAVGGLAGQGVTQRQESYFYNGDTADLLLTIGDFIPFVSIATTGNKLWDCLAEN